MPTRPGIACRYRPEPSLAGVPAILLRVRGGKGLIEFEDHGVLETSEGYLNQHYRFRRHKWVPLCHIKEGTR